MNMLVPLPDPFISEAGKIQNLVEIPKAMDGFRGLEIIYSLAGSRRSSHYHRADSHYLYVHSGAMVYTERRYGSGTIVKFTVHPGELVYTSPMVEHWSEFPVDTLMVCLSRFPRPHEEHERDVVRVPWIEEEPTNDDR